MSWCKIPVHQVADVLYEKWIYASEGAVRKRVKTVKSPYCGFWIRKVFLEYEWLLLVNFDPHISKCHLQQRKAMCILLTILNQEMRQELPLFYPFLFYSRVCFCLFPSHSYILFIFSLWIVSMWNESLAEYFKWGPGLSKEVQYVVYSAVTA